MKLVAAVTSVATGAMSVWLVAEFDSHDERLPVRVEAPLDRAVGHLVAPRCRRHLAVPDPADRRVVPAGDPRHRPAQRRPGQGQAVLRVAAAARGRRDGLVHEPRPVLVLRVLRDRARADVLPDRRLGLRGPRPGRHEVLPVHDDRLGVHAGVDHGDRVHRQPQRCRPRHVRPRRDRRERRASRPRPADGCSSGSPWRSP